MHQTVLKVPNAFQTEQPRSRLSLTVFTLFLFLSETATSARFSCAFAIVGFQVP